MWGGQRTSSGVRVSCLPHVCQASWPERESPASASHPMENWITDMGHNIIKLCMHSGAPNAGPGACTAGDLLTESSPQPRLRRCLNADWIIAKLMTWSDVISNPVKFE